MGCNSLNGTNGANELPNKSPWLYIVQYTILYYVMSAGKFKSLKMGGLNDVLTITATLQLTKTQI